MILADFGAEVLRIDRPVANAGDQPPPGPLDRGKYYMSVDLRNPQGAQQVLGLVDSADVLLEGFRPGVAERLGVGPEVLKRNPRIVYGRMTGWGQDGPLAPDAGHDINYIAVAGALDLVGRADETPVPPGNLIGDFAGGGMLLALGILAALLEAKGSGRGQVVDAAMVDGAALLTSFAHGMHAAGMWNAPRGRNITDGGAPFYDTYRCADSKFVALGCMEAKFYGELLDRLGIDPKELPPQLDPKGWPDIRQAIAEKLEQRTRDEWAEIFADSDACVSPVLSPWEAHDHPHHKSRRGFVEVGGLTQPAPAPRFSRTPNADPRPPVGDDASVRTCSTDGVVAKIIRCPDNPPHGRRRRRRRTSSAPICGRRNLARGAPCRPQSPL
ncbi:CaiB/BaiF CoA transferase family protein [[Mycobacterium] bulgaricum]|uniref:CaiB/BaiF CoA transferase family protein n=1 Tax=[Mycobacterium] bulgaricum TaxID=3238985 RepID=UPI003594CDAF